MGRRNGRGPRNGDGRHTRVRLVTAVGTRLIPTIPFFEDELRLVPSLAPPGGTCVDVGAAHGIYTVAMAAAVGPSGRVVSFEPQPFPHRVAATLRAALGLRDVVELRPIALGNRTAAVELVVPYRGRMPVTGRAFVGGSGAAEPQRSAGTRSAGDGADDGFTGSRRLPVQVRPLDELAADLQLERLDLVKIDVEGAELHALIGAERTLTRFRPALIIEIEDRHTTRYGHRADAVLRWLAARGYRAAAYDGRRLHRVDRVVAGVRNYVFVAGGTAAS